MVNDDLLSSDLLLGQNLFAVDRLKVTIEQGAVKFEKVVVKSNINVEKSSNRVSDELFHCGLIEKKTNLLEVR